MRAAQPTFGINLCYGGEDSDLGVYVEKVNDLFNVTCRFSSLSFVDNFTR